MGTKAKAPPEKKTDTINEASGLSDKQEAFCRAYILDFNATQAAITAGYAKAGAHVQGSRLLSNVKVQKFLAELQKPVLQKFEITQERIMQEVASLAFSNVMDFITIDDAGRPYVDLKKCTREQAAALAEVELTELPPTTMVVDGAELERDVLKVKIKTRDKWGPLESLMKRHGLIKEVVKVEHEFQDVDMNEVARRVAFMLRSASETKKK